MSDQEYKASKIRHYLGGLYDGEKWLYNPQMRTEAGKQCVYVTDSNGIQYDDFELADDFAYPVPDMPVVVDMDNRIILDIDIPF